MIPVCVADGAIQRADGEERIEFLAKVRNKTLEPLWRHSNMSRESGGGWEADRIIFSNDVYLCTKDIVRLMLHKVDVVCGLDYGERTQVISTPIYDHGNGYDHSQFWRQAHFRPLWTGCYLIKFVPLCPPPW